MKTPKRGATSFVSDVIKIIKFNFEVKFLKKKPGGYPGLNTDVLWTYIFINLSTCHPYHREALEALIFLFPVFRQL